MYSKNDPFTDTPGRICRALDIFRYTGGIPTHIILAVMTWDLQDHLFEYDGGRKTDDGLPPQREFAEQWKKYLVHRIFDVQKCKDARSTLLLQTLPRSPHFGS